MLRISTWFLSTVAALVLLVSHRTSSPPGTPTAVVAPATTTASATASATSAPATTAATTGTVDGSVVQTEHGAVQVRLHVTDGTITRVDVLQAPSSSARSSQLTASATPALEAAVLAAQSADVDTVSGATATSEGYLQSLQAALDSAGLA